jgi:acyl dehydratase
MIEKTIEQTQALFDNYGVLNGDNDILHYDDAFAKERGFRGTLGHGLMYTAYVADLAAKKYGRDWHYRGQLTVKFVAGVCPGDQLTVTIDDDGAVKCQSQFATTLVGTATLR